MRMFSPSEYYVPTVPQKEIVETKNPQLTRLTPHQAEPCIYFTSPVVVIHPDAYRDMCAIVSISNIEVGWLGTAEWDQKNSRILIDRIFMPKQECASWTTELTEAGLSELCQEILHNPDLGINSVNKINFWGHSHVDMDVGSSTQDDTQLSQLSRGGKEWFLRGIANRQGKLKFTLNWAKYHIEIEDLIWMVDVPVNKDLLTEWQGKVAERVQHITSKIWVSKKKAIEIQDDDDLHEVLDRIEKLEGEDAFFFDEDDMKRVKERLDKREVALADLTKNELSALGYILRKRVDDYDDHRRVFSEPQI